MMKLVELKEKVYDIWVVCCEIQHRNFDRLDSEQDLKATVRPYGDLRRKSTWEAAFCALNALMFADESEPQYMIEIYLIDSSKREGWRSLLPLLLCHLAQLPNGYRALCDGLKEIQEYGWIYTDPDHDTLSIIQEMVSSGKEELIIREQLERLTA